MRKLKLTATQEQSLTAAITSEIKAKDKYSTAVDQVQTAASNRMIVLGMIYDAHGIDPKEIDPNGGLNLKNGVLTLGEANASDRIRKAVKQSNTKGNGNKKVKA